MPTAEAARLLGSQGGKARRQALTREQRAASASKAGTARWRGSTKEQRRAAAQKAARARWAKGKKMLWVATIVTATLLSPVASFAGQGWYLLEPPIRSNKSDRAAPLHAWSHVNAFDTARECQAVLGERGTQAARDSRDPSQQFRRAAFEAAIDGRCIASDDLRLKP